MALDTAFNNATLVSSSVKALGAALNAGNKAETAIVDTTLSVTFMAMERMGRTVLAKDNLDADKSAAETAKEVKDVVNGIFDMVLKHLVYQGRPVYRDSDALFVEHVKPHDGRSEESKVARRDGVRQYIMACRAQGKYKQNTARDLVWTVSQVRNLVNKVMAHQLYVTKADGAIDKGTVNDKGVTFARRLAQIEGDGQFQAWRDEFHDTYGRTFRELNAAFIKPTVQGDKDPAAAILASLDKVKDLPALEKILKALTERVESERKTVEAAKASGLAMEDDDAGIYDSEVEIPAHTITAPADGKAPGAVH